MRSRVRLRIVFDGFSERSLAVRLALGPLGALAACETVEPIAAALAEAHSVGLLHGRLAPSRVLLDDAGAPRLDFTALEVGGTEIERSGCEMEAPEGLGFCMLVGPAAADES